MKKWKRALALMFVMLAVASCGSKRSFKQVDAGDYVIHMMGEPSKETLQIPISVPEKGLNETIILTKISSEDLAEGANYVTVEANWADAIAHYKQAMGSSLNIDQFYAGFLQVLMENMLAGALYDAGVQDTIQKRACIRYTFTMPPADAEDNPLPSSTRKGAYIVFVNEQSLIVLLYVADEDGYNEKEMNQFFQSIRFK